MNFLEKKVKKEIPLDTLNNHFVSRRHSSKKLAVATHTPSQDVKLSKNRNQVSKSCIFDIFFKMGVRK